MTCGHSSKSFQFLTEEFESFHLVEPAMENAGAESKESDKALIVSIYFCIQKIDLAYPVKLTMK